MEKKRDLANILVASIIVFGLFVWCLMKPPTELSKSERRKLKQMPQLNMETVFGKAGATFMDDFEKYAADQFPMREGFRSIHSAFALYALNKREINDLYRAKGYTAKLEYTIREDCVDWSLNRMNLIRDKYLANSRVFLAVIPDKNYYLAGKSGYPYLDYEAFLDSLRQGVKDYATFIDLKDQLSLDNYYSTDTHWKQETLPDVAAYLYETMGYDYSYRFEDKTVSTDFSGVYYGQLGLPVTKDTIKILTGDYLDGLKVQCFDTGRGQDMGVYDMEALQGLDGYEVYLSGSKALITIENPKALEEKELVIFRDSFGSSMAPLLAGNYSKVTLVDIRYINPAMVGRFVNFDGADVLFLYSAQVLNNSVGQFIN